MVAHTLVAAEKVGKVADSSAALALVGRQAEIVVDRICMAEVAGSVVLERSWQDCEYLRWQAYHSLDKNAYQEEQAFRSLCKSG